MIISQPGWANSTPKDKELVDVAVGEVITLTTSAGRFNIYENQDGSLDITESGHGRLVVRPKVANGIQLTAERF